MKIRITACDVSVRQKDTDLIDLIKGKREYTLYFKSLLSYKDKNWVA